MHLRDELESATLVGDVGGWWQHPSATVDPSAIVHAGAWIGPNVDIGADCLIGPNAVIGGPGFGYDRLEDGTQQYRTHTAGVVIRANVHIHAGAFVDQGRTRPTTIGEGSRVDNGAHIAHGVQLGRNVMVVALAELSGSVDVGDDAWIGPSSCVRQGLKVGAGSLLGMGSVLTKNLPPGETWAGVPARKMGPKPVRLSYAAADPPERCQSCRKDLANGTLVLYCGDCDPRAEVNPVGGASRGMGRCTCPCGRGTNPGCPVCP